MNKDIFLQKIRDALSQMSDQEKVDILRDYEEHFFAAKESGKSEQEIIARLGDPVILAKSYLSEKMIKKIESSTSVRKKLIPAVQSYFLVAGLGFFNVIVFAIPYFVAFTVDFALWIGTVSFTVINLLRFLEGIFNCILKYNDNKLSLIFFYFGNIFFGIILLNIVYFLTNALLKIFVKHIQLNLKISGIKGESKI
jgi:uncharacterized membrane protein